MGQSFKRQRVKSLPPTLCHSYSVFFLFILPEIIYTNKQAPIHTFRHRQQPIMLSTLLFFILQIDIGALLISVHKQPFLFHGHIVFHSVTTIYIFFKHCPLMHWPIISHYKLDSSLCTDDNLFAGILKRRKFSSYSSLNSTHETGPLRVLNSASWGLHTMWPTKSYTPGHEALGGF